MKNVEKRNSLVFSGGVGFSIALVFSLLGIHAFLRLIFMLYNWSIYSSITFTEFLSVFVLGLRFDLSTIVLINSPILLACLLPFQWFAHRMFYNFTLLYLGLVNGFFIAINMVDVELYNYMGRRLTRDVLSLSQDIQTEAFDSIFGFWHLSLVTVVFIVVWYLLVQKGLRYFQTSPPPLKSGIPKVLIRIGIFVILVIASRGGLQLKPINVVNAYSLPKAELAHLSLNSAFTLIKSGKSYLLKRYQWLTPERVQELSANNTAPVTEIVPGQNVVFIILESFALEFVGAANGGLGYTPFLDGLVQRSTFFNNGFANGRRSIEAIPSLFCGLPSLMRDAFITSQYQSNNIRCLPQALKKMGYESHFYHGAKNGTMYFDSFSERIGFDNYYGLSEYPNDDDFDGTWGAFDEPYLLYVAEHLSTQANPFFALIFTLSSHHPYIVPEKYKDKFPKGTLEIHESVGYADYALKKFFEKASEQPWYDNTLFVLTADHTQKSNQPAYADEMGRYRVPWLIFHSQSDVQKRLRQVNTQQVIQHVDFTPTMSHLLGLKTDVGEFFGRSIYDDVSLPEVYNGNDDFYWWQNGEYLVEVWGGKNIQSYNLNSGWGPMEKTQAPKEIVEKALYRKQLYNELMLENKLVR